jgi:hypothetical protein
MRHPSGLFSASDLLNLFNVKQVARLIFTTVILNRRAACNSTRRKLQSLIVDEIRR